MVTKKPDCTEVIKKADKAIADKNKALELSDLAFKACQDNAASIKKENNELQESRSSFYRNPFIMALLGGAAVSVTYLLLKK